MQFEGHKKKSKIDQSKWRGCKKIVERKKTGFSIPVEKWSRKYQQNPNHGLRGWAKMVHSAAMDCSKN